VAKYILQALNLREFGPRIISCPTCSRCKVNLVKIVERFENKLREKKIDKPLRVAIMGCVVNGPGEAYQADIGVAFGEKRAVIFRKNKILGYSNEKNILNDIFSIARKVWK
jgi:(E)-4-hydroxy-3-methylbut-2-enyl-diphosphate synthase